MLPAPRPQARRLDADARPGAVAVLEGEPAVTASRDVERIGFASVDPIEGPPLAAGDRLEEAPRPLHLFERGEAPLEEILKLLPAGQPRRGARQPQRQPDGRPV